MRLDNPACSNVTEYMECNANNRFRKIDGTCNGLTSPRLGSRGTRLKRLLPGIPNLSGVPTYLTKPIKQEDTPGIPPTEEGEDGEEEYEEDYGDAAAREGNFP